MNFSRHQKQHFRQHKMKRANAFWASGDEKPKHVAVCQALSVNIQWKSEKNSVVFKSGTEYTHHVPVTLKAQE